MLRCMGITTALLHDATPMTVLVALSHAIPVIVHVVLCHTNQSMVDDQKVWTECHALQQAHT